MISTIIRGIDVTSLVPVHLIPANYKILSILISPDRELFITYALITDVAKFVIVTTNDYVNFLVSDILVAEKQETPSVDDSPIVSLPVMVNGRYFLHIRHRGKNDRKLYGKLYTLNENLNGDLVLDTVITSLSSGNFLPTRKDTISYMNNVYHMVGIDPLDLTTDDLKHFYSTDGITWQAQKLPTPSRFLWYELFYKNYFYNEPKTGQVKRYLVKADGSIDFSTLTLLQTSLVREYNIYLKNDIIFTNNSSNIANAPMYVSNGIVSGSTVKEINLDDFMAANSGYNYNSWDTNGWFPTNDMDVKLCVLGTRSSPAPNGTTKNVLFVYNARLKKLVHVSTFHQLPEISQNTIITMITYNTISKKISLKVSDIEQVVHLDLNLDTYLA